MAADVNMWSSEAWSSAADMYLLARTREGSDEAFAELWRRHLPAAYAVAHRHMSRGQAEDIVAEAATRVLALLKDGRGPDENFRSYFLTAVRSVAVDTGRRDLRIVPTADADLDALMDPVVEDFDDDGFDPELVREAFRKLPERDQRVLWHTTVEGETPRVVGPALGMSANGVSVRAMRAREALRVGYLEAHASHHLSAAETAECRWAIGVLPAHVRGRLPKRASDRLNDHLAGCGHEAALHAQLRSLQDRFPALIVPLVFLAGASAPGFLSGAVFAGSGAAGAGGAGIAGAELTEAADVAASGAAALESTGGAPPGPVGPDVVSGLAGKLAAVAAGVVVGAGILGATHTVVPVAAQPPVSSSSSSASTSATSSGVPSTSSTKPTGSTSSATATVAMPVTSRTTSAESPASRLSAVSVRTAAPSPSPASVTRTGSHTVELRVISSGTPTRFSLRFGSTTSGDLRVTVSNLSGTGRLSAENGAFTCRSTSRSSVQCTGRTGQLMLSQSGLARPEPVVVRVTDSTGATSTRTLRLG